MKSLIIYEYPPIPAGLSMQGDMLYRGMKENGESVMACDRQAKLQKEWIYKTFRPEVAVGVGCWDFTPDIVLHPQKFGIMPVPWLLADGWVANYHETLSNLPLVFVTSEWVKTTYKRDGIDTKNFEVVPIGVEPEIFKPISKTNPEIKRLREMIGVKENESMILTIGGDVTSKGAQEIIKALSIIDKDFPNWKYVFKTWGPECSEDHRGEEEKLIEELKLNKEKFIYLEEVYAWEFMPYLFNACDIYAAPSRLEGFGLTQLQAQACGIPVISIDLMGPKETIVHGKTGFLAKVASTIELNSEIVHPHMGFEEQKRIFFDKPKTFAYRADVNDIVEYLLVLMLDSKKRMEIGNNGREHAVKNFHYQDIAKFMATRIKDKLNIN